MADERRQARRFGVRGSSVRYKRSTILGFLNRPTDRYLIVNLSETGAEFLSRQAVETGKPLDLEIAIPGLDAPLTPGGKVVWCERAPNVDAFRLGVHFDRFSNAEKLTLRSVLADAVLDEVPITTRIEIPDAGAQV